MSAMKKFTASKGQSRAALSLFCSLFRLGCFLAIDIGPKAVAEIKERDIYNRRLSAGFMSVPRKGVLMPEKSNLPQPGLIRRAE
jgi:hypothetical protein